MNVSWEFEGPFTFSVSIVLSPAPTPKNTVGTGPVGLGVLESPWASLSFPSGAVRSVRHVVRVVGAWRGGSYPR